MKSVLTSIFLLLLFTNFGIGQTNDNISWSSVSVSKKIDDKNSFTVKPIIRHNNNLKSYQNSSIDLLYARSLDKHWSLGFISRTWFVPDAGNRQFLWFDVRYRTNINKFKIFSGLRYHLALDINENIDADFIRWKTKISFPSFGIFTAGLAFEPWLRLNGFEQLQRTRLEPSLDIKLNDELKLSLSYWREEFKNVNPAPNFNIFLVNLGYTLK